MRRLAVLAALLAAIVTAACAEARTLVRYEVSGGLAGTTERLVVDTNGRAHHTGRRGGDRRFTVPSERLRALERDLEAARFGSLRRRYAPPSTVYDGFTRTVRHRGRTVTVSTGADVPERLGRVLRRLSRLVR